MKPYQYHRIEGKFPVPTTPGAEWESIKQLGLADKNGDDGASSKITYLGVSTYNKYHKFAVRHETIKDCWIRVAREDRKRAIFIEEFNIYMPPNKTYLLVNSSHKISRELLKRIRDKVSNFEYLVREIDLQKLKEKNHPQVRGGWFRDLEIDDVSTAAIFGSNVSDSDEWDKYESSGTLSSLVVEFSRLGKKHSINISANGAITLYSNENEKEALTMVEMFNDIVMKYQTEYDVKKKGSKTKE